MKSKCDQYIDRRREVMVRIVTEGTEYWKKHPTMNLSEVIRLFEEEHGVQLDAWEKKRVTTALVGKID